MKTRSWSAHLVLLLFVANAASGKSLIQGDMIQSGDTAHLEFKGLKNWTYDVQRKGSKVLLTMPAIDDASAAKIQSFADSRVSGVQINRSGPDGSYQFVFDLADKDIETFDYLTDEPSRLIIDFYKKVEPKTVEEKPQPQEVAPQPTAPATTVATAAPKPKIANKKKTTRKPAGDEFINVSSSQSQAKTLEPSEDNPAVEKKTPVATRFGIFDGGDNDYDRFRVKDYEIREEAIVASRQNIYLAFPMLKMPISKLDEIMSEPPEYIIRPLDTRENQEARLLLTLFERGRTAVFLKTYDYFLKKYPESTYNELIKNVAADVQLERWKKEGDTHAFEQARSLYKELIEKYPTSPLRERNHLILGFALMERGEALATLQLMQSFLDRFPSSKEVPQIRKGMAESFIVLRKFDEAIDQLKIIMRDYPKTLHYYEAQYRQGDVWFAKGDYNKAIQTYEDVIKKFPEQEKLFPNADYNLAEAQFWQKDYKRALNQYITFVSHFPTHTHGGYALTRIGELMAIFGVDQRRVMGAFLESYFRFPSHDGAEVARIRMLSQQMRGMKEKELKKSLEEINKIAQKSKVTGIQEFTSLMTAEALQNRGEYIPALDQLISYYQKNPGSLNLDAFRSGILRNISNEIKSRVDRGDFMKALEFYSKYSATWLKNSDRIDVPFYIANAYETAGAYDEANKLYAESLQRRKAIVGTEREKERKAHENLPSVESLQLRSAATAFASRNYMESYQFLKAIGQGKTLSPKETVERVELASQIYEQRNDIANARESLIDLAKHWQGDPQLMATVHARLAEIYLKSKDFRAAEESASKVIEAESADNPLPQKLIVKAYQMKGDALIGQKKNLAAAEVLQSLLEKYEEKEQLGVVRYNLGKILFDRGDMKGAENVWKRLAGTPNDFLWKLGEEKIKSAAWQDDYTKYTSRIPAMVQEKKQESQQ